VTEAERSALDLAFQRVDAYRVALVDELRGTPVADTLIPVPGDSVHALAVRVDEEAFGRPVRITLVAFGGGVELYRSESRADLDVRDGLVSVPLEVRYTGPGIRGRVTDPYDDGVEGVRVRLEVDGTTVDSARSAPDGSYLFPDLTPRRYTVYPDASPGVAAFCPGAREVTVDDVQARLVADFRGTSDLCRTDVLILSMGDVDDATAVADLLSADPSLEVATHFAHSRPPGVAMLLDYDVVLLFTNGTSGASKETGDSIAAYVQGGGNVVVASFYWQSRSDAGSDVLGWGGLEAMDPFSSEGGAGYVAADLGTVAEHPLTDGVLALHSDGFRGGVSARADATVVAWWDDGTPLVGFNVLPGGQRIVGVSLFPASAETVSGDVGPLWRNATRWAGAVGGPGPSLFQ
jgi:hypothetical protein